MSDVDIRDIAPDEEFYLEEEGRREEALSGRLYLIMSNQQGLAELRRLWEVYRANPNAPDFEWGSGRWREIFNRLRDIREWGPADRLRETGLLDDWRARVDAGQELSPVEIELWFRSSPERRGQAAEVVRSRVIGMDGEVVQEATVEEIRYHAILARLPIRQVDQIAQLSETRLATSGEIMFLRPVGQVAAPVLSGDVSAGPQPSADLLESQGEPVVALLDGLPLENHVWLMGRIVVDDPDGFAGLSPAQERRHGTAMASLILHGELDQPGAPLGRPVYIRPIMIPDPTDFISPGSRVESIPDDVLPLDLIHRAVTRMFSDGGEESGAAPSIKLVSISVCDRNRLFDRYPSPIARLLDFLAWKHDILFVVAAGNHPEDISLEIDENELIQLVGDPERLQAAVLKSINDDARNRRLLSPAEAINALTVGALHTDASTLVPLPETVNPMADGDLNSPISAQGSGFRRSVKPDLMMPGGRQLYRRSPAITTKGAVLEIVPTTRAPGHRVAAPSATPGVLDATSYVRGTSNAAALATRLGAQLYELIGDLRRETGGDQILEEHVAVLIKTLLVHSSRWRESGALIAKAIPNASKDALARLLGYGSLDPGRLFECTSERATLLGCGKLGDGEAHRYELPLPQSLSGQLEWRRLTATLSWMSPINPSHRAYRRADLWVDPYGSSNAEGNTQAQLGVQRLEVDWRTTRRGTIQHELFEGDLATVFGADSPAYLQVNCKAEAGKLPDSIPYSLAVSLEVSPGVQIPIYDPIQAVIRQRVEVTVRA